MTPGDAEDAAFLAGVEAATWPGERFGHREHVRLAWLLIGHHGPEEGAARLRTTISRYATALGAVGKYHETMTWAWSEYVARALRTPPRHETFADFWQAHAHLRDSKLLARHYRAETLGSERARRERVEPDLEPLPAAAP